jgi:hypothetical protein
LDIAGHQTTGGIHRAIAADLMSVWRQPVVPSSPSVSAG